jgi:hypothetical protein
MSYLPELANVFQFFSHLSFPFEIKKFFNQKNVGDGGKLPPSSVLCRKAI